MSPKHVGQTLFGMKQARNKIIMKNPEKLHREKYIVEE